MATINDVPIEILCHIFRYLGVKDIVRLRSVNKLFNCVSDMQKINDLMILDEVYQSEFKWFYSGDKIDMINTLKLDLSVDYRDPFGYSVHTHNLLSNLKRLKISNQIGTPATYQLFQNLSKFPLLEQFDYDVRFFDNIYQKLVIRHNNLKIISIYNWDRDWLLELDTVNLEYFRFPLRLDDRFINIRHSENLKYLCASLFWNLSDMTDFENLEHIVDCWSLEFSGRLLQEMPKLIEIRFKFVIHEHIDDVAVYLANAYESFVDSMSDLNQTKDKLNRTDLQIYFNNVELISVHQFKEYAANYENDILERYADDYDEYRYEKGYDSTFDYGSD